MWYPVLMRLRTPAPQPLLKPCLLIVAGGLAAQHITLPLSSDLASIAFVASVIGCAWRASRSVALVGLGFSLFILAGADIVEQRLDEKYAGDSMLTRVRIVGVPQARGVSLVMQVTPLADARIPRRVRLSWFEPPFDPQLGDVWQLEIRLRQPRGLFNPGVFDYETWMFREGYHASGYVVGGPRNRLLWAGDASLLERVRERFVQRSLASASSREDAAVLAAVGVGARHLVTREQWDAFALTGTTHLMAISGLHVSLAASVGFVAGLVIIGPFRRRGTVLVPALVAGGLFAAAYAVISGFGVPSRRAAIMLVFVAAAIATRRQVDAAGAVAVSAVLVYCTDPVASVTPGFQLSFGAVILLLWLARRRERSRAGAVSWLRRLVVVQMFLAFGLLPLTTLLFQRIATIAPLANLVAVPLFSFVVVPLVLAALATGGLADVTLQGAAWLVEKLQELLVLLASIPLADTRTATIEGRAWLFVLLPLAWVALPRGWPGRHAAVIGVLAILAWRPLPPPAACFDTWFLDVGQGLAIVVQAGDRVMLYDAGVAWRGGGSVAEQVILPFLVSRGMRRIDLMVVSHGDLDHSGGARAILAEHEVGRLIAGDSLQGLDAVGCAKGLSWVASDVRFEVVHPAAPLRVQGNDGSCVVRISSGPHAVLLTGDIEVGAERALVQSAANIDADVVLVPHHGSLTSSSVPFVDSVRPRYAVVSAGYANRWDFPKAEVVQRWRDKGAQVMTTATSGAVFFRVCADGGVVEMRRERPSRRRFWHAGSQ